jgi:hypothetical protein
MLHVGLFNRAKVLFFCASGHPELRCMAPAWGLFLRPRVANAAPHPRLGGVMVVCFIRQAASALKITAPLSAGAGSDRQCDDTPQKLPQFGKERALEPPRLLLRLPGRCDGDMVLLPRSRPAQIGGRGSSRRVHRSNVSSRQRPFAPRSRSRQS